MGFGAYAVPAAEHAFKDCDCLLAIGTRFSEIPTGSFSMSPPQQLIHMDINSAVFNKNYPATVTIEGDAKELVPRLLKAIKALDNNASTRSLQAAQNITSAIKRDKEQYMKSWYDYSEKQNKQSPSVSPARFFNELRTQLNDDAYLVADDGNHTFLTAELMPIHQSKHFICPSDFNCMGYCVPATIACKLAHPEQQVVGIVGDGALMMTAMELVTATTQELGLVMFVFNDGELSQISQAQNIPYNRKTCTVLGGLNIKGVADATGADYRRIESNEDIATTIQEALALTQQNKPVVVDVNIDYSKATRFTQGVVAANLKRFSLKDKARFIGRALKRKVTG
jgi:acetolactate synthase-1/2/3 large subunit